MPEALKSPPGETLTAEELAAVIWLRHRLHARPEPAGNERATVQSLTAFLTAHPPDRLISRFGGGGLAAVYDGEKPGPTVAFRAELDAVSVTESSGVPHASTVAGLSHACGHDGHMAILAGLAVRLARRRPAAGRSLLLFQPAEETGEGAGHMIADLERTDLRPEGCFALHNLPGFPLGTVLVRPGIFSCASVGVRILLRGSSSHAAHPEEARSPGELTAHLIGELPRLPSAFDFFSLITVTHVRLGYPGFGVTPGESEILLTLRTAGDRALDLLVAAVRERVEISARSRNLETAISFHEPFPALVNDREAVSFVRRGAEELGFELVEPQEPFRWSEDFGHFTARFRGAMFAIGAGLSQPPLHSPSYDFPDVLISKAVALCERIGALLQGS